MMAYHAIEAAKTHCAHGHYYTAENTYVWPKTGWRSCVTCRAASEYKARRRRIKNRWRVKKYGITVEQYTQMMEDQDGFCAICYAEPATHIDHDHETGRVRGLLCGACNRGLGQFKEDADTVAFAAAYLKGE